ncbi:MAG: Spx/MgsR family RNA polymerase-binding regulatory protein [Parvibaculales bacterium]
MLRVYGLKNCDSCRKALKWLAAENIAHEFVDLRADGVSTDQLKNWISDIGVEKLVNKSSTSWRQLDEADKQDLSPKAVLVLLKTHITLVKRPVFDDGKGFLAVGFKADTQATLKGLS